METNMEHVREVAKALLFTDIHETKFSPMIVQHPFTSSGIVGLPTADGVELVNICESHKQLERWQDFTAAQIDECESPLKVYMLINKPYAITFLDLASPFLSQEDFSGLLSNAWIRAENPNLDPNINGKKLVSMFKAASPDSLMDAEERT